MSDHTDAEPIPAIGWQALFSDGHAAISVMLAGGVAIHALSLRVVSTVLPTVVAEIGGLRFFAWTTTVAVVGAIWGASLAASVARSWGLRRAYRISLALFAAGSITCAIAPDMAVFLIGRLFQGLGGGLLTALAYTTIQRVFPHSLRTRAIVLVSGIWGVAALCGPMLGGVLAGWGLWRWAFWVDVPVAIMLMVLAEFSLARMAEPTAGAIEVGTAVARLSLLGASVLAVATGSIWGTGLSSAIGLGVGAVPLIVLLRIEQSSASNRFRLLPTGAYRPRNVLGAVSLTMALTVGSTMAVVYLPYVVVEIGGYAPIFGGYLSAVLALSWTAASFVTASAERKWAVRSILAGVTLVVGGMVLTGVALIVWSMMTIALALILVGGGIGVAWAHLANLMMAHARAGEHDISSAFISTNQMVANSFASALAGMVANLAGFADPSVGSAGLVRAVAWVFFAFSLVAAGALPVSLMSIRLSSEQ